MAAWEPTMTFITDNRISSVEATPSRVCLKTSGGWRPACRGGRHLAVRKCCTKSSIDSLSVAIPPGRPPGSTAGGTHAIVATLRQVPVRRQNSGAFTLLEADSRHVDPDDHAGCVRADPCQLLPRARAGLRGPKTARADAGWPEPAVSEGVPMELWVAI